MNYQEIYKHVTETKCFGVKPKEMLDGIRVGISSGIDYLINHEPESLEQIEQALLRFFDSDFGTMFDSQYENAFKPTTWEDKKAYGEYEIDIFDEPIYIHYEPYGMQYDVVIYLNFER